VPWEHQKGDRHSGDGGPFTDFGSEGTWLLLCDANPVAGSRMQGDFPTDAEGSLPRAMER